MGQNSKVAVLKISEGDAVRGFSATLEIAEEGKQPFWRTPHALPPGTELFEQYQRWQTGYYALGKTTRWRWHRILLPDHPQTTNVSVQESTTQLWEAVQFQGDQVETLLQEWFEQSSFRDLREEIISHVGPEESLRLILDTRDRTLQRLPWHCWPLFEKRPNADLVMAAPYRTEREQVLRSPLKILAVLGLCDHLQVENDLKALHDQFPDAQIQQCLSPRLNQLKDLLFYRRWDVLLFAGHSASEGQTRSKIYLGDQPVPIAELTQALATATRNGLKLAIFNSCDGLGLAEDVSPAQIPNVVVMREPIPDEAAQDFLRYFLTAFRLGEPFHLAVRHARERLQAESKKYPQADWLPVIFQNPSAPSFRYRSGGRRWGMAIAAGLIPATLLLGFLVLSPRTPRKIDAPLPELSPNRQEEDKLLDAHMSGCEVQLVDVTTADKQAGVQACQTGDWAIAAAAFTTSLQQKPNDPETRLYQQNAQILAEGAPHFTVVASVPIGSNPNVAQEMLRGVAQAQLAFNNRAPQASGPQASDPGIALNKSKKLRVLIADDENDTELARRLAEQFVQDPDILAVIGHNATNASMAGATVYNRERLVMLTPTSFAADLIGYNQREKNPYSFRMVPDMVAVSQRLADYIQDQGHGRVTVCIDESAEDNASFGYDFKRVFGSRGEVVNLECDFAQADFSAEQVLTNSRAAGVDAIVMAPHVDRLQNGIDLARANQKLQPPLPLYGSPSFYTEITLRSGKDAVEDMVLPSLWHPDSLPGHPFLGQAEELWRGPVNWRTAMSYDATMLIAEGLRRLEGRSQPPNRRALQAYLSSSDFQHPGITGNIRFKDANPQERSIGLLKIRPLSAAIAPADLPAETRYGFELLP